VQSFLPVGSFPSRSHKLLHQRFIRKIFVREQAEITPCAICVECRFGAATIFIAQSGERRILPGARSKGESPAGGDRLASLPIVAAIALGAIVSPPDPVAANEVLRHLRIPQRIGLVLQGEGLLNDATALLIYGAAVTAAAAGSFSLVGDAPILVLWPL
jgi:Sodium/hydrogen exchanger family